MSEFADDTIAYVENSKEYTKVLQELMNLENYF